MYKEIAVYWILQSVVLEVSAALIARDSKIMTTLEFLRTHWGHYTLLEREFLQTLPYVNLEYANGITFSYAYQKLLLEIGSEVDVTLKAYCRYLGANSKVKSITKYREYITSRRESFNTQKVLLINDNRELIPWLNWQSDNLSPFWWTAYNKVKHNRTTTGTINNIKQEYYKFANQDYTLEALAGLFQTYIYHYCEIATAEDKRVVTPLPGSRLFELTGGSWDDVEFYGEFASYIDENTGHLIFESNPFIY